MNLITIDNCGIACPQPVINTKKALDGIAAGQSLISIVDNAAAKENVTRFAVNSGCAVKVEEKNGSYSLTLTKGEAVASVAACLLYTSPSPRDRQKYRMPSSA